MQEISLNILDVAQNSISAKATLVSIFVETVGKMMTVIIEDNGCGMTDEQVKSVTDPFYTTRKTRSVGLGVPLFKMAAEMSGGEFEIKSEVGKGTTVKAVFDTSNVDCMPLGDVNATISSLIQLNPDIDFRYRRSVDSREFELDTRQLREILSGVPLNTPEVTVFIADFLKENTSEIIETI